MNRQVLGFRSLDDFCKTSPFGMELTCVENMPVLPGWRSQAIHRVASPDRIRQFFRMCLHFCHCVDNEAATALPTGTTATMTAAATASMAVSAPDQCPTRWREIFTTDDGSWFRPEEECVCNEEWYGHPLAGDCVTILNQLLQNNGRYEFLGPGVEPAGRGRDQYGCRVQSPAIQGPIIKTNGKSNSSKGNQRKC